MADPADALPAEVRHQPRAPQVRQRLHPVDSIIFFARPGIPRRNFDVGAAALARIADRHPAVRILLYGLDEPVELPFAYENLGHVGQAELARLMTTCDIHLSFSLTNVTTVVYEAMACGCACIEADVEPVRPMVEDGVNVLLAPPDVDGTVQALDRLVGDVAFRRSIAAAGRAFATGLTEDEMGRAFQAHVIDSWLLSHRGRVFMDP